MATIPIHDLQALCLSVLSKAGLRDQDAVLIVDHYLENELSGKSSHGMVRVIEAAKVVRKFGAPKEDPAIALDSGNIIVCDAKSQMGPVAGSYAMNLTIARAPEYGIVFCGIRNFIGNSGSMNYYLRRLTDNGLIAMMGCNSVAMVAPPAGRARILGTNPFGIGIPGADGAHFIGDFATSAIPYGKIKVLKNEGKPMPENVLIDADGNPSTNPDDAHEGAILPLAGYAGFSLGLMIELLAGPLIGAKACKSDLYDADGLFIIAIDPAKLDQNDLAARIAAILDDIRSGPTQPGFDHVAIPGDRAASALANARVKGHVDVIDKTYKDLQELAA